MYTGWCVELGHLTLVKFYVFASYHVHCKYGKKLLIAGCFVVHIYQKRVICEVKQSHFFILKNWQSSYDYYFKSGDFFVGPCYSLFFSRLLTGIRTDKVCRRSVWEQRVIRPSKNTCQTIVWNLGKPIRAAPVSFFQFFFF